MSGSVFAADPKCVKRGENVFIGASIAGDEEYDDAGSTTLRPDGTFEIRLDVSRNSKFIAALKGGFGCSSANSDPVDVRVKSRVRVRTDELSNGSVKVLGRVAPKTPGTVYLRRITATGNRLAATSGVPRSGRFSFTLGRGLFAIRFVPADGDVALPGRSKSFKLRT